MSSNSKGSNTGPGKAKNADQSESVSESHKITTFFPVLRPEGRAKMCAFKAGDSKQKEILQKLKSQDSRALRNKSQDSKSDESFKDKSSKNVSVMSALKTPLSQVLRRSMATAEVNKKDSIESQTEEKPKIAQRAKKSFSESESRRTLRHSQKMFAAAKSSTFATRSSKKSEPLLSSSAVSTKKRVTLSDSADSPIVRVSEKISASPIEDIELATSNQSGGSGGNTKKKRKRRHFRGGTYGLFLTKKCRKKQKLLDDSKDEELSQAGTENSSYIDSDEDNSLMSEGLYTPSEKSLVEEEHNPDSRSSPVVKKEEVIQDLKRSSSKDALKEDTSSQLETKVEIKDDKIPVEIEEDKIPVETEEDKIPDKEEEHKVEERSENIDLGEKEESNLETDIDTPSESTENQKLELDVQQPEEQEQQPMEEQEEQPMEEQEEQPMEEQEEQPMEEQEEQPMEEQEGQPMEEENEKVQDSEAVEEDNDDSYIPNSEDEQDNENEDGSGEEQEEEMPSPLLASLRRRVREKGRDSPDGQSTIATCVKSRQRIKRRFTDDIVDTEFGLLSVNPSIPVPRKAPVVKENPPQDFIQTLNVMTRTEAKKGPITKIECIYNHHQEPIKSCCCDGDTYEANMTDQEDGVFCQAVDSIDDKLVGCTNPVVTMRLVRSSVKIPFTVMCEMHLWRLKHHHSCPYCGLFCSQGPFLQCSHKTNGHKAIHLFHDKCQAIEEGMEKFCLHCGNTDDLKKVVLEMHMASPPSFYLSQLQQTEPADPLLRKARMSFSSSLYALKKEDDDLVLQSYRIKDTGKVLSSVGLNNGPEKEELERLLVVMNEEGAVYSYYSPEEFYFFASQGNVSKILNILAQGVDPNQKYSEHDGDTALHAAALSGHTTVAHLLIQAGAVNDTLNDKMSTPLMLAVENNHKDIVFYLVKNGAFPDYKGENGMNSLHLAAKNGNLDIIKTLMTSRDIDINAQDDGGWTPIVWASEHDHYDAVRHLLQKGANPNLKDNELNTGLHWSAFSGSVDICFLYLEYGCEINAVNERGDTPLHIAARQDSLPCVTLFLSRGADVQIKNKADQYPADCVIDKSGDTYLSLSLNLLLKKIASRYKHKAEKILHRDISRGKESISIQCVNDVDDEPPPTDFLYVTENCETTPMNIDRTITSLQSCHCDDDCATSSCTCASISYQCWYDKDGLLLPNFNLLDPPMLFECNRACSCWSVNCRNRVLQNGMTCRLQLFRTKGKGWGVRTLKDIPKGTFICEYVGEMISDSAADKRADDSYLFDLDNRDGETYCLDARYYGNVSRFINHLCEPSLVPVKVYVDHQDLNFPRMAFFSSRDIKQYEELGFDYGEKFWVIKYKYFTCYCGSPRCKYSKDTIQTTLANYYRRVREEQMEEATQAEAGNNPPALSLPEQPPEVVLPATTDSTVEVPEL